MGWFGPSKDEMWRELCREIGAEFIEGGFWKQSKVRLRRGDWTIMMDVYGQSNGEHSHHYTRLRARFANAGGFRFSVHRKTIFTGLARWLGMRDIEVGGSEFDEAFVIKGNDEPRVRLLFEDREVRRLLEAQQVFQLSVGRERCEWGQKNPSYADMLKFRVSGVVKDVARLKGYFSLFVAVLERLEKIGVAEPEEVELAVRA